MFSSKEMNLTAFFLISFALLEIGNSQICKSSSDCNSNKICLNSKCKFCLSDLECQSVLSEKPYCRTDNGQNTCQKCLTNSHCTSSMNSRCLQNDCAPCVQQSDCTHISGARNQCFNGVCVGCFDNTHCASGMCNMSRNQCQGPACPCSATSTTPFCSGSNCEGCSASQNFCLSIGLNCSPDGSCQQCWENNQCSNSIASQCAGNVCKMCSEDKHCSHILRKNRCEASQGCVECLDSMDCAPGQACVNYICNTLSSTPLVINLSGTEFPDLYIIDFPLELVENARVDQGIALELIAIDPGVYRFFVIKITETRYEVHFQVDQTIPSTQIRLVYTYYSQIRYNVNSQSQWEAMIPSKRIPYISEQEKSLSHSLQVIGETAIVTMAVTSGSIMFLGGNPTLLWMIVSLIQNFYYLTFINVYYPANVQFFLKIFVLGKLDFFPNPFQWIDPNIEEEHLPAPARFEEYEVNGLFLAQAGNMLLLAFGVFILYGASYLIKNILNRWSRLLTLFFTKICLWFKWSGALRGLLTSYSELTQAAFLQIRELNFSSESFIGSSIFGIIFSIYSIVFPIVIFLFTKRLNRNNNKISRKYIGLFEEYSLDGTYPKYFTSIFLIKRLIVAAILVFLHDFPHVEISFLMLQSLVIVFLLIKFNPYSNRTFNTINTTSEFLFTMIHMIIFVLIYDDHTGKFSDVIRLNIGWGLITTCGIILIINMGLTFSEMIKTLHEYWQLAKRLLPARKFEKKFQVRRIVPIEKFELKDIIPQVNSDSISIVTSNFSFIQNTPTIESFDAATCYKRRKAERIGGQSLMIDHIQELTVMEN